MAYTTAQKEILPKITKTKEDWSEQLLRQEGIHGLGICLQQKDGKITDQLAIMIVYHAVARESVMEALPNDIDGYPIEFLETNQESLDSEPHLSLIHI